MRKRVLSYSDFQYHMLICVINDDADYDDNDDDNVTFFRLSVYYRYSFIGRLLNQ